MNKVNILDVWVHAVKKETVLEWLKEKAAAPYKKTYLVATTYSEFIVHAQRNEQFNSILNSVDLNVADGVGILWSASFLNKKTTNILQVIAEFLVTAFQTAFAQDKIKNIIPEQISGADLIFDICKMAQENNLSVFLLGGHGPIDQTLQKMYPDLKIAGRYEGKPGEQGMVEKINESEADILLVAFGPVKQEKWLWENKDALKVKLAVGLGGTFDYVLGDRSRAGENWRRHGLEWLHRLITQPWRWRRMWNAIVVFTYMVIKYKINKA